MTRVVRLAAARARAAGRAPGVRERPVGLAPAAPPSRSRRAPRAEGRGLDGILR